jgi:hypothetical protein
MRSTTLEGQVTTRDAAGALPEDLNASVNFSLTESMGSCVYLLHMFSVTCPAIPYYLCAFCAVLAIYPRQHTRFIPTANSAGVLA